VLRCRVCNKSPEGAKLNQYDHYALSGLGNWIGVFVSKGYTHRYGIAPFQGLGTGWRFCFDGLHPSALSGLWQKLSE